MTPTLQELVQAARWLTEMAGDPERPHGAMRLAMRRLEISIVKYDEEVGDGAEASPTWLDRFFIRSLIAVLALMAAFVVYGLLTLRLPA